MIRTARLVWSFRNLITALELIESIVSSQFGFSFRSDFVAVRMKSSHKSNRIGRAVPFATPYGATQQHCAEQSDSGWFWNLPRRRRRRLLCWRRERIENRNLAARNELDMAAGVDQLTLKPEVGKLKLCAGINGQERTIFTDRNNIYVATAGRLQYGRRGRAC